MNVNDIWIEFNVISKNAVICPRREFIIHKQRTTNILPFTWVTVRPEVVYVRRSGSVQIHLDWPLISVRARIGSNSTRLHPNWLGVPHIWYHLFAHLLEMKDLLFVCRYVEPFRSNEFPIDRRSAKFVEILGFFTSQIFCGTKIKISKCRSSVRPPREFCVKIFWQSIEGRKKNNKKVQLQNISRYA